MNQVLIEQVTHQLEMLPDDALTRVLDFIAILKRRELQGTPGSHLLKFAGTLRAEDAKQMLHAIEQDCRRVDVHEW
ncbi:hypothetical protein GF339_03200 [candidate division KSB3 bacterium]|uniref:DUF2281 domain-containing protein n=1 Tax=candidate division KSB3 bacterium TaxID=2044937 RepID=A0A9D5Q4R3_9BACT|nr:hypothetical protein [candidate division KSB3 bacterium]MBD3323563.1 hypothetical protein [candidate division KSB3 bacterium]